MEQIDSGQIHLWFCFHEAICDPLVLKEYVGLLSTAELHQQRRFCFERDRQRYLVTRALVRTVLSKYAPIAPQQWQFATNHYGRPQVANEDADARGLTFNISHTEDLIVLGVTHARAIGVDVEKVRMQRADIELADRFFAPEEVATLRALPPAEQPQRFFEYWTLKESYIKARGLGLSIALDGSAFHLDDAAGIRLSLDRNLGDYAERWAFWQFEPLPAQLLAVCVACSDGDARLSLHRSVPCRDEAAMECRLLRRSGGVSAFV